MKLIVMKNQTLELPCPVRSVWPPIHRNWHHQLCAGHASSTAHHTPVSVLGTRDGAGCPCALHQPYVYGKNSFLVSSCPSSAGASGSENIESQNSLG